MGVAHGQPPSVASTVLAQLFSPQANESEMGTALFTNKGEGRNLTATFYTLPNAATIYPDGTFHPEVNRMWSLDAE